LCSVASLEFRILPVSKHNSASASIPLRPGTFNPWLSRKALNSLGASLLPWLDPARRRRPQLLDPVVHHLNGLAIDLRSRQRHVAGVAVADAP